MNAKNSEMATSGIVYGFLSTIFCITIAESMGIKKASTIEIAIYTVIAVTSYYNIFGQESRAASPAFPPSRA